jgi:CheY-like chemotaxis protein
MGAADGRRNLAGASSPPARPRALAADDDPAGRMMLKRLLERLGYDVAVAADGAEAVERFAAERPDLVFLDVMMPVMDGLDAAPRIKALAGDDFVPVIFVTGATEEDDLVRCMEAGGDDVMTKPYKQAVLAAKVHAMERIRALHRKSAALYARVYEDQLIAEAVFRGAVMGRNAAVEALRARLIPAAVFSGDLLLSAHAPSGDLYVLFGDFTGHGLAATLGALPTAETFRAMTGKGFAPEQILFEISRKLKQLLTPGLFLAATFVRVSRSLDRVSICNAGMPDALVIDRAVRRRVASSALPLGIVADAAYDDAFEHFAIERGERIVLASDGVCEAVSPEGELFGTARFEAVLLNGGSAGALDAVTAALDAFRAGSPLTDDVSLVQIECTPQLFAAQESVERAPRIDAAPAHPTAAAAERIAWRFELELKERSLSDTDPVPLLLSQLREIGGLDIDESALYTVLAELYSNALEHGVLELDSRLKDGPDGFDRYFAERARRLEELREGWVRVAATCTLDADGGRLRLRIHDSGSGFDWRQHFAADETAAHGRGIKLLRALCESLDYEGPGNCANAVFAWRVGAPRNGGE